MPIELKMPALSPTMEEGTLAKWLVKEGDSVSSGDLMAEIETDKATMEFEAVDEGVIKQILIPEGTDNVKVGTVIALIAGEDESPLPKGEVGAPKGAEGEGAKPAPESPPQSPLPSPPAAVAAPPSPAGRGDRIIASPLAKRIAEQSGVDLAHVSGTGPNGRIVKADVVKASPITASPEPVEGRVAAESRGSPLVASGSTSSALSVDGGNIPHTIEKLSNMRKTIARRLTQSMQEAPHIYLSVDIRLDALLKLRSELNASLEARGIKLSVNDMLIKALALALHQVPACNVSFAGDNMVYYTRADISVAVSIPGGLITPIVADAGNKSLSTIATEMNDLAARAKEGKLAPQEYQGGTASISNMGMMGIKHFTAVINPPQAMIMAVGAGEKRPYVVDDALSVTTVMTCTGSFDHRAIDGADGAALMKAFKELVEKPLGLVA